MCLCVVSQRTIDSPADDHGEEKEPLPTMEKYGTGLHATLVPDSPGLCRMSQLKLDIQDMESRQESLMVCVL